MPEKSKIIIVGTAHKLQCGTNDYTPEEINNFKSFIEEKCESHGINLIAEEMSYDGLIHNKVVNTIAYEISFRSKHIKHRYIDLTNSERINLQIDDSSLSFFSMYRFSPNKEQEKLIKTLRRIISNPVRECCWFARILNTNIWPTLLICGDDHVKNMKVLIQKADKSTLVQFYHMAEYQGAQLSCHLQ